MTTPLRGRDVPTLPPQMRLRHPTSRCALGKLGRGRMGDTVDKHVLDRRRVIRDFWLRITIPAVLFAGLLVLLFTSVSLDALPPALLITGAALLIGGAIGFLTG